ncbi:MAG: type III-A CRISPR-associated RAMP protein Csm3, partial [Thermodesulfobacteriota bacterium]
MNLQFQGKYIITGKIICETGLHIGGTQEGIEIGGVDNIVIRDPLTDLPYIPGSSLKGKLRHLLEWELNKVFQTGKGEFPVHSCENDPVVVKLKEEAQKLQGQEKKRKEQEIEEQIRSLISQCPICLTFGSSVATLGGTPTRLTVRDAFPIGYEELKTGKEIPGDSTISKWRQWFGENIYTELKTENAIDRVTSEANPRTMERVPAGSEFHFEMIFDIYRNEDKNLLKSLFSAMHLLENSALGGSGTRGHGKIKFEVEKQEFRSVEYYKT